MSKKKPDLYDLFNDDSLWGTQETESLTHEEIMDVNWNRTTANRAKWTPEYKQMMNERVHNNKEVQQRKAEAQRKGWNEENRRKAGKVSAERWKEEWFQEKRAKAIAKANKKPEVRARRRKAEAEKWADRQKKEAILRKSGQSTPIQSNDGLFLSLSEAAEYYNMSLGQVRERLLGKVKTNEHNFRFISWEEYDQLKS